MARCVALATKLTCSIALSAWMLPGVVLGEDAGGPGATVYAKTCAVCHDKTVVRMPSKSVLQQRTSAFILKTLNSGVMKEQASGLTPAERTAVAGWLGRKTALGVDKNRLSNACSSAPALLSGAGPSWTSWGGTPENLRFQPSAAAGIAMEQAGRLKLKWAFGVPDVTALRSQPAVYGGSLLLGGGSMLYSLDAASGCTRWATELPAAIRSGISIGSSGGRALAFFGDGAANVYAVDVSSGAPVWQVRVDSHPSAVITGTPVYHGGRLYVPVSSFEEVAAMTRGYVCCTFRGSIVAMDAVSGKILWQTFTIDGPASASGVNKLGSKSTGPSGAAVWSAPTIDTARKMLYAVTGDNYSDPPTETSDAVLALALDTGKIQWSRQFRTGDAFNVSCMIPGANNCPDAHGPDLDFGASPILLSLGDGKRALFLAQKSGGVYAIDPDDRGKLLWQGQVGHGGVLGGVEWGPATDLERIYVALSDEVVLPMGMIDPSKGGGLFALSVKTGELLWNTPPSPCEGRKRCSPAQSAAVTAVPGLVFSGSLNGHLRAYSAEDGKVLWDYDTGQEFKTVNGVPGHGGSIGVAGPVVAGGTVYVLSGYDTFGESPGNVLLAFSVDGH